MPGGLAKPAPRRSATPESAARSRPERPSAAAAPALALAPAPSGRQGAATTRDRLRASFGAQAPAAAPGGAPPVLAEPAGAPLVLAEPGGAPLALAEPASASLALATPASGPAADVATAPGEPPSRAPAAAPLTTRERIVNGARAVEAEATEARAEPAAGERMANVIDIELARGRRRRRLDGAPTPATEDQPATAESVPGAPGPPARAPPAGEPSAAAPGAPTPASETPASTTTPTPASADAVPAAVLAVVPATEVTRPDGPTAGEPEAATANAVAATPAPAATAAGAGAAPTEAAASIAAEAAAPSAEQSPATQAAAPSAEQPAAAQAAAPTAEHAAEPSAETEAAGSPEADAEPAAAAEGAQAAAAAVPAVVRNPEDEPGFQAMKQRARRTAAITKTHQPAAEGAATAQGAALAPDNDLESQAAAEQVEVMGEQEPGVFDAQAFITAVKRAIEAATPATLEDADEFKESGAVGQATAQIDGLVKGGKENSEQDIRSATEAAPDISAAVPKGVADMVNDEPGASPAGVGAAAAMPGPRPQEQTDLSAGPAQVDAEMATANVTDEQIARSNEPDFSAALDARQKARDHAATAPAGYRAEEETILAQGREAAAGAAAAELEGMQGARVGALGGVLERKQDCKSAHETEHARVAGEIEAIYEAAKADVEAILGGLDTKVDDEFTRGEEAARTRFENDVDDRMREYKQDRYDRIGGGLLWLKDKIAGMPDEVNEFYEQGRADYLTAMDAVIERIANIVGGELTAARARIVEGRAEVRAYVEALPEDLRALGEETQGKLEDRFDELTSQVDAKQDALVDAVARRYVESRDALDARIEELQAANKGLVAAALDAVVGVIKTILALGEMLLRVLARAADVVGVIISDPIGFLGNLVAGVMGGLSRFVARIATHLENALSDWLFATLGSAGITLPKQLDGAGILDLAMQVTGLTYANIRARVARVVGEPAVAQMEETVEVFKMLASGGVGGLWELVSDKLADLEDTVLGRIKEWVVERVIKGGITWIIGLLNPVAAFIKACKAIYEIVMFIVERAKQVMEFVDAILDSISAIAKGDVGAAEEKVESSLARALPLAIGFLASLLGLGNISEKVKSIVASVRRPIERAIDAVVMGIARAFQRTFGGAVARASSMARAGRAWAQGKIAAGREWAKGAVARAGTDPSAEPRPATSAGQAARAPPAEAEGAWIWETVEAGHAVRISPGFEVFRFSSGTLLAGGAAQTVQQAALESQVARTAATYPTDALGRADGPSGFVKDVKDGEGRSSMPAVHTLPGGVAAYEPGDVRGHLIGDRFFGPASAGNLVPMHATLNGSTFLSFETRMANAYKAAKAAGRGALLSMQITPDYPAPDPANPGRKYRPDPVRAACKVFSLDGGGGVAEQPFDGSFTNPSNATTIINLNSADRAVILAAYSGQLTPDVHALVDAIIKVRPRRTVDGLALALAYALPAQKMHLFEALLGSRGTRFVVA